MHLGRGTAGGAVSETATAAARRIGISRAALYMRFAAGWKLADAMSLPKFAIRGRRKGGKNRPKAKATP